MSHHRSHEHGQGHGHGHADESASVHEHRKEAPASLSAAIVTVSDTRDLETDLGGALIGELLAKGGVGGGERVLVKDEVDEIRSAVTSLLERGEVHAILITGGTGLAPRDVTPEALAPILEREIPGFGELFRMLSYEEVGTAAILSRATAGIAKGVVIFALPGSRGAIRTAVEKIVLPELGHLVAQARKGLGS